MKLGHFSTNGIQEMDLQLMLLATVNARKTLFVVS